MLKFIKNNKWWVTIISIFAIFFSSFGIFAKSYVDSNKQKIVNKIQNYVQASSYAVQSRILKKTENLNEDYLNQKIGKKSLLSEFNSDFIWRPNNSKTTSSDTISDLWKTYFGSSNNVLNKDLQIQYKNNNEYKNIDSSKGEITPKNIDFLLSISKSAEKFLNGFAPSLASLGLSFLQNKVLNNRDDPKFQSYKNGLNKFADIIENNKDLFSYLGKLLTPKPLEKDYYKDLTVQQALVKNINQIAAAIADNKEFAKETEVDKLPEALDKILVELGLNSLAEIIGELINSKNGFENLGKIFSKIKNIFTSQNLQKLKIKGLELLDKITPHLATYLYSEIFFGLYYVAHEEIKNPNDLLVQKTDDSNFLALINNKLDFKVLLNGIKIILKDKKGFERFYNFIFKRFDENKIFNNLNNISSNKGTGSLIYDLINWLEEKINSFSSKLNILIRFVEIALNDSNIIKIVKDKIVSFIKDKLPKPPMGKWTVKFKDNALEISLTVLARIPLHVKLNLFGQTGLFNKLITILKSFDKSTKYLVDEFFKYIKNVLYLNNNKKFNFSFFQELINNVSDLLKDDKNIYITIAKTEVPFWPFGEPDMEVKTIYDILTLPYNNEFLNGLVYKKAGKDLDPILNKIKTFLESLKKYKFITEPIKLKDDFSKYLENLSKHLITYENGNLINFNLLNSFYNGNIISDFVHKWIDFLAKDISKDNNSILAIFKAISKDEKLENLKQIKDRWTAKISELSKKIQNFENITKIKNIKINLPENLLKQFGLESLNIQTIYELIKTLNKYFNDYLSKNPNKVVGVNISSLGKVLTALTIKVGVEYRPENKDKNFLYSKDIKEDKTKTILKALVYGFDTHDNSSDVDSDSIKNRKPESYYNWDKIHFYINGSSQAITLDRTKLKEDSSYSPLHMLLGINPDKSSYVKDSLGYVFGTLFGGLPASDSNYQLSIENKTDATSILSVFNYVLDKKDKELKKQEEQIATKYYDKNAWSTKILSSNENEITYELIRLKISDTKESKRLGTRFEVRLLKNKNNPYGSINRVIALDYKVA
ncbi:STREFT protein [Mycoplasma capricolum]|uniref:STREFT protein n=1 Tax=Mycoplasma capricolum TaxID=2095 RepID=UPI0014054B10|nr:STREFT protein [Mycoplasma capricolum]QIN44124.1 STREFT protein [Mycoplasma capricolum subsp. capripneumoniae]